MLERGLLLGGFFLLLAVGRLAWRWLAERHARQLARADRPADLVQLPLQAGPAVLYFTTASCAQCRLQQAPMLAQVQAQRADFQLLKLDAVKHSRLASYYHVMTVPTTVVLDQQHRPVAINHGVATADRLLQQLALAAA